MLLVETGQTYDRKSIEEWFQKGHRTCPLTGRELQSLQVAPNYAVRGLVQAWREEHSGIANGSSAAAQSRYPAVYNGALQHELQQVDGILQHIRSPSMEVKARSIAHACVRSWIMPSENMPRVQCMHEGFCISMHACTRKGLMPVSRMHAGLGVPQRLHVPVVAAVKPGKQERALRPAIAGGGRACHAGGAAEGREAGGSRCRRAAAHGHARQCAGGAECRSAADSPCLPSSMWHPA